MKRVETDVDIDVANRDIILKHLQYVDATGDDNKKHNTGVYFQDIPYNPITGASTLHYDEAKDYGFFKLDFLNLSVYENIESEQHLLTLLNQEPNWDLLQDEEFVKKLIHVNEYSWLLKQLKPRSIQQLAAVLAIIRPSKRYLKDCNWEQINNEVWIKPKDGGYYFKKSHSIAYSHAIIVQMNLLSPTNTG